MSPKIVDHNYKREIIIKGTIKALSKSKISELKISDIAKEINIGKSTIYEYFKTKEELITKSLEYFLKEIYIPIPNDEITVIEDIEIILSKIKKQMSNPHSEEIKIIADLYYESIKGDFKSLKEVYSDFYKYMINKIEKEQKNGIINQEINPKAFIYWLGASFDGLWMLCLLNKEEINMDEVFISFLDSIKEYIKK